MTERGMDGGNHGQFEEYDFNFDVVYDQMKWHTGIHIP